MILDAFYAHPMYFIGLVFALLGAMGVGFFFAGFFPGLPHLFTLSAHEEHQDHYRDRIVRGTMLVIHVFILWEIVRLVGSWITGEYVDPSIAIGLVATYLIVLIILTVSFAIAESVKNRH